MASGMTDVSSCHINTGKSAPEPTGSAQCQTPAGLSDMVGNVWEWVDDQVTFGKYEGRELPPSGFVSLVDSSGVVVTTQSVPSTEFGEDYAWTESGDIRGIIRGGFYGNGNDAGIFAQNLSVPLDFRTTGVGFRCVRDL
jgi:formylglycine-generating enzyme required for sulfatase activity